MSRLTEERAAQAAHAAYYGNQTGVVPWDALVGSRRQAWRNFVAAVSDRTVLAESTRIDAGRLAHRTNKTKTFVRWLELAPANQARWRRVLRAIDATTRRTP